MRPLRITSRVIAVGAALGSAVGGAGAGVVGTGPVTAGAARAPGAPRTITTSVTPLHVCGNARLLSGPSTPPAGAISVPAGDDSSRSLDTPGQTYWFAPGAHTLGSGEYAQVVPADGDVYLGAPGAVLTGQGMNLYAFGGHATNVTIEYLTIEDFGTGTENGTQGVVNHTSSSHWTIEHDTVTGNAGAGVMLGSDDELSGNCLSNNTQYGFSAYSTTGQVDDLTVTNNEVSGNATVNWTTVRPECGCSGGAKFWQTVGAVVTGNYVHDNLNVGLWVDTDNAGFDMSGNYIAGNSAEGIIYEISYNAVISGNVLVDNGWKAGATPNLAFPEPAIYVSESGGDRRVAGPESGKFDITDNVFLDNWGGVVLWENANRFCGNGASNLCTLVDPSTYSVTSCKQHLPDASPRGTPDYFANCRWRTMNVSVTDNTFVFTPKVIGPSCTVQANCGFNGVFSEFGSVTPYQGWVVPRDISDGQHNVFADNVYKGPWRFQGFALGDKMTWSQWTHGVSDVANTGNFFAGQDKGSAYR